MHAYMDSVQRRGIMADFRSGSARVLITIHWLAARFGMTSVPCTVNFNIPATTEEYIIRIGIAGRFGRSKDVVITLLATPDMHRLREIELFYNTQISPWVPGEPESSSWA